MRIIFFISILSCFQALSLHQIAFFKIYKQDGRLLQLEVDGRYSHIALRINEKWLHSHPLRGVELIDSLDKAGFHNFEIDVLNLDLVIKEEKVYQYINKPYDRMYSWSDQAIYCSELIAKIFDIPPTPMNFDSVIWREGHQSQKGEIGISPDEIFDYLIQKEFNLL